jgi:hypothetical protein
MATAAGGDAAIITGRAIVLGTGHGARLPGDGACHRDREASGCVDGVPMVFELPGERGILSSGAEDQSAAPRAMASGSPSEPSGPPRNSSSAVRTTAPMATGTSRRRVARCTTTGVITAQAPSTRVWFESEPEGQDHLGERSVRP